MFAQIDKIFENSNWQNIWKFCPSGWIPQTPMNIGFQYFIHALTTILPWILWSFVRIKFKMLDFSPFLFAQFDKTFKNFVRLDKDLQHQWIFVSDTLHIHYYNPHMYPYNLQQNILGGGYHWDILVNHVNLLTGRKTQAK